MNADSLQLPIEVEALRRILKKYGVISASVFGSYARGSARMDSDLDLLVTYAPHTSLFKVIDLQDELESATGNRVDLVSKKYVKPRLARSIEHDLVSIL
jgi:predicted nucleotidyltransferase